MNLRTAFACMLQDLRRNRLEVVLAPNKHQDGGMIRVVVNRNPEWYRRLCVRHPSSRKRRNTHFDTRVKRQAIDHKLWALSHGSVLREKYVDDLIELAHEFIEDQEEAKNAAGVSMS